MIARLLLVAPLFLAACGGAPAPTNDLAALDRELVQANATPVAADPALRSALRDQIMVDPALTQQANNDALRPPPSPATGMTPAEAPPPRTAADAARIRPAPPPSADCPQCALARRALTLGALAAGQGGRPAQCAAQIGYSAAWANKLPAGVPLYPGAQVREAAGADRPGCALRIVSFSAGVPMQRLLDWYYTRTSEAGFAVQHQADGTSHVLGGTRQRGAFLLTLTPRTDGGVDADLMADGA